MRSFKSKSSEKPNIVRDVIFIVGFERIVKTEEVILYFNTKLLHIVILELQNKGIEKIDR